MTKHNQQPSRSDLATASKQPTPIEPQSDSIESVMDILKNPPNPDIKTMQSTSTQRADKKQKTVR